MNLLFNIALFLLGFLPAAAVAAMVLHEALGDRVASSPEWEIGLNPVLWFILMTPWLLPVVVVVPVLQVFGKLAAGRSSPATARRALLAASPIAFALAVLALWGPGNFRVEFVLPVVVAGVFFGALMRIPVPADTKES